MLNEKAEFESYVKNPESPAPRIQPKLLTGNFGDSCDLSRIEHILIVIARGYIFNTYCKNQIYSDGCVCPDLLDDTKIILLRWLSFPDSASSCSTNISNWEKRFPEANGWFKKYWSYWISQCTTKSQMTQEKLWNKLEKKWLESLLINDYRENQITLTSVIAQALSRGPLKEQYLVFRRDPSGTPVKDPKKRFEYLYSLKSDDNKKSHYLQEKTRERLLKNIAVYLLNKNFHPKDQKFVLLYKGALLNWYGLDDKSGERELWYFPQCVWGKEQEPKEQIMKVYSTDNQWNFIKLTINQEFLSYFDFKLIEPSQVCDVDTSEYWILKDIGHGVGSLMCLE